jgi:Xaa-Pro aminopeptidase
MAARLARVRERLAEQDMAGVLVTHLPNVRYLTGFSGSSGALLVRPDQAIFATDGRYAQQAAEEIDGDVFELLVASDGLLEALTERAGTGARGERVAFESRYVSHEAWERMSETAGSVRWTAISGIVEALRAVKDAGELARIEKAADLAARALVDMLPLVRPGVREAELAAELDFGMRRLGASGPAFETIVSSGPRTALPHAATSDRRLREGDLVLFDFGARWAGYAADLTRVFVLGRPQPRQVEVYEKVLAAQRSAMEVLRDGAAAVDVDRAARSIFAEVDLEDRFPHSTGHGVGLEVHEGPRLSRRSEERVEAGMVVTVEPGLYFADWGGIRIEDDVVVTEREPRPLVDLPRDRLVSLPL